MPRKSSIFPKNKTPQESPYKQACLEGLCVIKFDENACIMPKRATESFLLLVPQRFYADAMTKGLSDYDKSVNNVPGAVQGILLGKIRGYIPPEFAAYDPHKLIPLGRIGTISRSTIPTQQYSDLNKLWRESYITDFNCDPAKNILFTNGGRSDKDIAVLLVAIAKKMYKK